MKDKIIISIISKIYISIVSFFSFIILFLIFLFFILQNGLYLDNLHISNFYLKNSYIRVDNKLHISIDDLIITQKSKSNKKLTFKEVNNYLKLIPEIIPFIGTVTIGNIEGDNFKANFDYSSKTNGLLSFNYKDMINCKATIFTQNNNLAIHIKDLNNSKYRVNINGDIVINTTTLKQYSKLNILLNNDANLTLNTISDKNHLNYAIKSHNNIQNIKAILNLIPFGKDVKYWANDAIKAKYVTIKNVVGEIDFNNINDAYKHIYLDAIVHSLKYKYNQKLEAISSKQTELIFKNAVLYIKPHKAYTYNTYLKNSWLKINFRKKHEFFNLYLHLDGKLNNTILYLLSVYKIVLPFKQNSGLVKTDLHLKIDLRTIKVDVDGDFFIKKANMDYLGMNLNLFNSHIHLHNNLVSIDKMRVKYKNILDTNLTAIYNVKKELGDVKFIVNNIKYNDLELNEAIQKPHILYHISKNKKFLKISRSQWKYKKQQILINAFSMPYDANNSDIEIPPVTLSVKNIARAFVNGNINIKNKNMNFDIDLFKFNYKNLKLNQSNLHLVAKYDTNFTIKSMRDIYMSINNSKFKIKKFKMIFNDKSMKLQNTSIEFNKYISSKININHIYSSNKASIKLENFIFKSPNGQKIIYKNNRIKLQAFFNDNFIIIKSPQLNATFFSNKNRWELNISSLDKIAKNLDILKKLNLSNSSIKIYKKNNKKSTRFIANIIYPYSILMNKDKQIHKYNIVGQITKDKKIDMNINKDVNVTIDNKIEINLKNCAINIKEIIKLIKNIKKIKTDIKSSGSSPKIYLNAINSYLYIGKNKAILSDKISMQYIHNITTAKLIYKNGTASFRADNSKFYLYGKNFNDKFMEPLLAFSKFKGGKLNFSIQGTFNDYSGVFFINNTTIIEYKLLNNILAFVNTIPSLVTFSLPDYNKDGLHVKSTYLHFSSKNNLINISDFYLNSKELKILGKGTVNLKKNKINLLLNLKTDLASTVSKIPLVGYIIFDGKSISTTLKVTGKLDDPKIQTQLMKDIVVAPLNIIKRTLTLPYILIKKAIGE